MVRVVTKVGIPEKCRGWGGGEEKSVDEIVLIGARKGKPRNAATLRDDSNPKRLITVSV